MEARERPGTASVPWNFPELNGTVGVVKNCSELAEPGGNPGTAGNFADSPGTARHRIELTGTGRTSQSFQEPSVEARRSGMLQELPGIVRNSRNCLELLEQRGTLGKSSEPFGTS
jgi:hypothetical protein